MPSFASSAQRLSPDCPPRFGSRARAFQQSGRPYVVVANKMDKLKKSEIEPNLAAIRQTLQLEEETAVIPFSAEKGQGRDELLGCILKATGITT